MPTEGHRTGLSSAVAAIDKISHRKRVVGVPEWGALFNGGTHRPRALEPEDAESERV